MKLNDQTILVVGIGSPHGADQAGWNVAQKVASRLTDTPVANVTCLNAKSPHQLFDWLSQTNVLYIIDAVDSEDSQVIRLECDQAALSKSALNDLLQDRNIRQTSHQFGLISVLQLAEALGQLPASVVLWGVPMNPADVVQEDFCADRILAELRSRQCRTS